MSGKKGMVSPRYTQMMKEEIKRMVEAGKTQTEIYSVFDKTPYEKLVIL